MDNIRLIFVLPKKYSSEKEATEIMIQAFDLCKQNVNIDVSWVKETDFKCLTLSKTDFVIFEEFKNEIFNDLNETKCARILGPWAVSICLLEGKSIPNFPWPIYNVAMYDCVIACSNLPKATKGEIKEKVQVMGGCYVDSLLKKTTHLVTDNPKSEKYLVAAEAGVKIMCSSWVKAVWEASQTCNIHADDAEFKEHQCLPFQNLVICCTGFSDAKRKELEKLIVSYGGKYSPKMKLTETDILVCEGIQSTASDKYKAARKRENIKCVNMSWVTESIAKGYALPHNLFQIKKATSTPTKNELCEDPNFSVFSAISFANTSKVGCIDESVRRGSPAVTPNLNRFGPSKEKGNLNVEYCDLVDKLDIKRAKKAGHYLDGCSVYITGFNPDHAEKLCKVLNLSGATRYDQISERVTHVIVGDSKFHEVKMIRSKGYPCLLVSVQWLLDSIEQGQPANEENYIFNTSDLDKSECSSPRSPLSKKGFNLLRSDKTITEIEAVPVPDVIATNVEGIPESDIIQQYLKRSTTGQEEDDTLVKLLKDGGEIPGFSNVMHEPPSDIPQFKPSETSTQQTTTSITQDETSTEAQMIFDGLQFLVIGFEESDMDPTGIIEDYGGEVLPKNYKGTPDYIVLPIFHKGEESRLPTEIVNDLFLQDCIQNNDLINDISYYHRPHPLPDANLLENCVITISGYTSFERTFLKTLIEGLGGVHQEQFARVSSVPKGVVASTHLICDKPNGKKYRAALKWGLPVVNKDWLLECAKTGTLISEANHVLEDESVSMENVSSENKAVATPVQRQIEHQRLSHLKQFGTPTGLSNAKIGTPDGSRTPKDTPGPSNNSRVLTPVNQRFPRDVTFNSSTEKPFSQATPVNKILQQYLESTDDAFTSPKDSPEHKPLWYGVSTPETPLGACIRENPSPQLRKECEYWLRQFPDFEPPLQRRLSTPLSEIKAKLWSKILNKGERSSTESQTHKRKMEGDPMNITEINKPLSEVRMKLSDKMQEENSPATDHFKLRTEEEKEVGCEQMEMDETKELPNTEESTQNRLINNRLQQLEEMLCASGTEKRQSRNFQSTIHNPEGKTEYKDSQAFTVGWDFREQENSPSKQIKIFMISGVSESERPAMVQALESLGAVVSDLSNYDPSCTHLLCLKPGRNEKILSCMAAGKWILHSTYVQKSLEAGHLLDEEEFEFGNPKSAGNFPIHYDRDTENRVKLMHWWRKEVARRGYGAFSDMRSIVVAQNRDPIIRVIEAGGGIVIDVRPPFDDTVHATHCLLEQRSVRDYGDYIPLAQQGIYLLNTVYISNYLHQPEKDVRECILPYFAKYYSKS